MHRDIHKSRVGFVAHALLRGELSTRLITERLAELGKSWPEEGQDPHHIRWFTFPVMPATRNARAVTVDFYIIPVLGPDFWKQIPTGGPRDWALRVADEAVMEAMRDDVDITVGWGAMTKNAVSHGQEWMTRKPDLIDLNHKVSSTHGDAGSVALVLEAMHRAKVGKDARIAVLGAAGPIGSALARMIPGYVGCGSLLLVGNTDKPGESRRKQELDRLKAEVLADSRINVATSQDLATACRAHDSTVVIVATNGGVQVRPDYLPENCLVLDITTPAACRPEPGWRERNIMVLKAGCGRFEDPLIIPEDFGVIGGNRIDDVGAGGRHVLWGCTLETIARSAFNYRGHVVGTQIPLAEVHWCLERFPALSIGPQLPMSFGLTEHSWDDVRGHVGHEQAITLQ